MFLECRLTGIEVRATTVISVQAGSQPRSDRGKAKAKMNKAVKTAARGVLAGVTLMVALGGLGTAVAVAAPSPAGQATSTLAPAGYNTLIGNWNAKGVAGDRPVEPKFTFNADGTFTMIPEDNSYVAHGHWQQKRDGSFTFDIQHYIYDASGQPIAEIRGTQAGKVVGNKFDSTGQSGRYDLDGNLVATFTVTISGTRA
jgi:hypothetical protein